MPTNIRVTILTTATTTATTTTVTAATAATAATTTATTATTATTNIKEFFDYGAAGEGGIASRWMRLALDAVLVTLRCRRRVWVRRVWVAMPIIKQGHFAGPSEFVSHGPCGFGV